MEMAVDLVITIVTKIGEYLVAPIGHQLGYLLCYDSNIEEFRNQVYNLGNVRFGVQRLVDDAERNGEVILPEVNMWLGKVEKITEESREFFDDELQVNKWCFNGHCPDLKLRYKRSKKAKKKTAVVDELKRDRCSFNSVSYPAPPPTIGYISTEYAEVIESRELILRDIMEAIKDDETNMIGIYGMGGVGKTTVAKEVRKLAKDANLFDEVVMATVSQTPDFRKIQDEIADGLGLTKFNAASNSGRAGRLLARLGDKKRKLVILDDIWDPVNLDAIGIPLGSKILFTSRRRDVCEQMNTQKNFPIDVLTEREAWNLFQQMVGDSIHSHELRGLAVAVAKECAGLPIAIVTLARALKNKGPSHWHDTVNRLPKSIPDRRVLETLELSYNYLESDEAKSFFLLCSLFPEDFDIEIQDLSNYGMGLDLFEDVDTLEEARERAHRLVNDLIFSCLLQDSQRKDHVKMHDVVRDVAISIASKGKHMFLVKAGLGSREWPKKDTYETYTAISIMYNNICSELPDGLECPKLQVLMLARNRPSLQFPNNFFSRMENLRVLDMSGMHVLSLPPSLGYLKNLRTLCLDRCSLKDVSVIGELKKLEILSFVASDMEELQKEIGRLTHLRLLDLRRCKTRIPPDVIGGLCRLEGLYMSDSFNKWEIERHGKERSKASLAELKALSHLTSLEIDIPHPNLWPEDLLLQNLSRFKISIAITRFSGWFMSGFAELDGFSHSKVLKFRQFNISTPLKNGVIELLKTVECLQLTRMKGLKGGFYGFHREAFPELKSLEVEECNDVEYLFNKKVAFTNLEVLRIGNMNDLQVIFHSQVPTESFCQLRFLEVIGCHKLSRVAPSNFLPRLKNLEALTVGDCYSMEEIFQVDELVREGRHAAVSLFRLIKVSLFDLPNLRIFCTENYDLELPSLKALSLMNCPKMQAFSSGSITAPKLNGVLVDFPRMLWKGDLNSTTQHLFQENVKIL